MTDSTLEELKEAEKAAKARLAAVDERRRHAINEAKAAVEARFASELDAARTLAHGAMHAVREHLNTHAKHPLEGKRVQRRATKRNGWGSSTTLEFGVVEVRRLGTTFPDGTGSYRLPNIGDPFVRLLKKDGTPGLKFDRFTSLWTATEGGDA